jgi:hypothetical protein
LRSLLAAIEDPGAAPPDIGDDPARWLTVARHHRLTPLVSALGIALPPALAEQVRRDRIATTARNLIIADVAAACVRALAEAGIPTVVLKGLAYERTLYAQPGIRPTADADLLVPMRARQAAFRTLDRLGFEPRVSAPGFDEPDYHEVAWTRAGVEIDLHLALAPIVRGAIGYDEIWAQTQPLSLGDAPASALAPSHAAVFHALHMAFDHFDISGLYLVDLARLLPTPAVTAEAEDTARRWRCHRAFDTAVALAAAFLPGWGRQHAARPVAARARAVIDAFGSVERLPRPRQLLRKVAHFDRGDDIARYLAVQGRRKLREIFIARRKLSARERLGLGSRLAGAR